MQDRNKSEHHSLVPGDGTQTKNNKTADANWFGRSKEAQEEFVQQSNHADLTKEDQSRAQTSEGLPTLGSLKHT